MRTWIIPRTIHMLILLMIGSYSCPYGDCPGWGAFEGCVPVSVLLFFFPSPSAAIVSGSLSASPGRFLSSPGFLGEPTETHQQEICPCILFFNIHWVGVRKSKLSHKSSSSFYRCLIAQSWATAPRCKRGQEWPCCVWATNCDVLVRQGWIVGEKRHLPGRHS